MRVPRRTLLASSCAAGALALSGCSVRPSQEDANEVAADLDRSLFAEPEVRPGHTSEFGTEWWVETSLLTTDLDAAGAAIHRLAVKHAGRLALIVSLDPDARGEERRTFRVFNGTKDRALDDAVWTQALRLSMERGVITAAVRTSPSPIALELTVNGPPAELETFLATGHDFPDPGALPARCTLVGEESAPATESSTFGFVHAPFRIGIAAHEAPLAADALRILREHTGFTGLAGVILQRLPQSDSPFDLVAHVRTARPLATGAEGTAAPDSTERQAAAALLERVAEVLPAGLRAQIRLAEGDEAPSAGSGTLLASIG